MKKGILSLVAVGLMATAANAATIGLRWSDTPDQKHLGNGVAELFLDVAPGDIISGANTDFFCKSGDCSNVTVTNVQVGNPPGWSAARLGLGGHIGAPEFAGLSAFAQGPPAYLVGSQSGDSYVLATFNVNFEGLPDGSEKGIGVDYRANPGGGVIDDTASSLVWDARYNVSYSGYIAYGGWGWTGWDYTMMGVPNMEGAGQGDFGVPYGLIISKVPEPTSLALVALGGFALLRRRSN